MKSKVLADARFRVVGVMDGDVCPAELFLSVGEESTKASRYGLFAMLQHVAKEGLQGIPSAWWHEANKSLGIYEFRKGNLRLFFFKGQRGEIAVCTSGVMKKGQKADTGAVERASRLRKQYETAIENNTYEVVDDEAQ